ncbi:RNA polymerase sigma factor [Ascidiimonas aurantiaca]|uniref:RNA polymerase sigma factor n=1 Tax=Ascidiimonas aurantiaca TaxID=1685432 RepID=UPI0030EF51B0
MTSELVLINQLKDVNSRNRAFGTLVKNYQERLYWHIRRIVMVHDDADDVLQNTFIKIFRNIENFKGESALYSWMYRIATNEAINFLNAKSRKMGVTDEALQMRMAAELRSDLYFDGDEIQFKLQKAIALLPARQKLVFNMRYFDDLSYNEISQILEISEGSLKASYHHAVKKIEASLRENEE